MYIPFKPIRVYKFMCICVYIYIYMRYSSTILIRLDLITQLVLVEKVRYVIY
jgi:hypothetical protein